VGKFVLSAFTQDFHHLYEVSPIILGLCAIVALSIRGIYNLLTVATPWRAPLRSFLLFSTLGPTIHLFPYLSNSCGEIHDPSIFLNIQYVSEFGSVERTVFFDIIYNNPWHVLGFIWFIYAPVFYLMISSSNLQKFTLLILYLATTNPHAIVLLLSLMLDFSPEMSTLRLVLCVHGEHYFLHDFTTGVIVILLEAVAPPLFIFSLIMIALEKWQVFVQGWSKGSSFWN